ncbi:MAG: ATP-dependent DNA helicase RecG [Candidatus Nanopelagicales bacterium]
MNFQLNTSLTIALGAKTAQALKKSFDMHTVEDLLRHFPRRYAKRGELTPMDSLQIDENVTVMAEIQSIKKRSMQKKRGGILEVEVTDGSGFLTLTFFNQDWRERDLRPGRMGLFSGKITAYRNKRQLAHPTYLLAPDNEDLDPEAVETFARPLISVYPATSSIPTWRIEKMITLLLEGLSESIDDGLSSEIVNQYSFFSLYESFQKIHRPQTMEEVEAAKQRFVFLEALQYQLILLRNRLRYAEANAKPIEASSDSLLRTFDVALPFSLTDGQVQVCNEIFADLAKPHPMHRLLQGEVGSGKTLCAIRSMLRVIESGGQTALLAPTEVLAWQHFKSIEALVPEGITVTLLTGSMKAASVRHALESIADGTANIVVGTHSLIQERVEFKNLELVVVDEQHRFGVEQRAALSAKAPNGLRPHVLVMTATPIPRTVAMTVFGDLDISILQELPQGRKQIETYVVDMNEKPHHVERAWNRILEEVSQGFQAYVVCPKISPKLKEGETEESSDTSLNDVESLLDYLSHGPLKSLKLAPLHGKMSSDEKEHTMRAFKAKDIDVLISTTVIEVGVDVSTATVMVIMNADNFGISQLHQLRGRVGRGEHPGLCLLMTTADADSSSRQRLDAVASTLDGFKLSEVDLEQRREGNVLGSQQSGIRSGLRLLRVLRDEFIIDSARTWAQSILDNDSELLHHKELRMSILALENQSEAEFLEKA